MNGSEKSREKAEQEFAELYDYEENQPVYAPFKPKKKIPGGNRSLPVKYELLGPSVDFWYEDMPNYILEILDETDTNGWRLEYGHLLILSDESDLGVLRATRAKMALEHYGATEVVP